MPDKHGATAPWFETHILPPTLAYLGALGSLDRLDSSTFTTGTPAARWVARIGEHEAVFRARIAADLKAEGITGAMVHLYVAPAHWHSQGHHPAFVGHVAAQAVAVDAPKGRRAAPAQCAATANAVAP